MSSPDLTTKEVKLTAADPTAIGLLGLALVTLVASSQKLGWTTGTALIIPWAIFLGASAQLYASITDSKRNNTFGSTAFAGYAFFWFGVAASWMANLGVFGEGMMGGDAKQFGFAFIGYLIFTIYMTIGSMETNKVLFVIFFLIDLLFLGLSLSTFGIAPEATFKLAAYSEFLLSLASFYGSAASVLNTHFGREFMPVGKPFGIFK